MHRRLPGLAAAAASATALVLALAPGAARAADPPVLACTGDPATTQRIDLTVEGEPTFGYVALPVGTPKGLVVFGHGYHGTAASERDTLSETATRDGVIAVAMDDRGLTHTSETTSAGFPVQEGAEDAIAAAQAYDAACPGLPLIVSYGTSMGGNSSGLAVAAGAKRDDGRPLFDYWFDVAGVTNVTETYLEATAASLLPPPIGSDYFKNAKADIEREMGGPLTSVPGTYLERSVVTRADDIKASGIKGVVITHGVLDGTVISNQSVEMAAALTAVGIPTDVTVAVTHPAGQDSGTTLDSFLLGALVPSYASPFAGHVADVVQDAALDRLHALIADGQAPSHLDLHVLP